MRLSINCNSYGAILASLSLSLIMTACGGGIDAPPTTSSTSTDSTPAGSAPPTPIASAPTSPASTPAAGATSTAITDANTCALPNYLNDLMNAVNTARAAARSCGNENFSATAPLKWNDKLFSASAAHSLDMAQHNYFAHNSQDGTTFDKRIDSTGYAWSKAGENIAAGQSTVSAVIDGWLKSPGHCRNIMSPSYKDMGVACVKGAANSAYPTYWTMDLAAPQ
jgi:uncharacterized protein YkwD